MSQITATGFSDIVSAAAISVAVESAGKTHFVNCAIGATLLVSLRGAGLPVASVCGGKASCGTCKVTITPECAERLSMPGKNEARLLRHLKDSGPHDRLSCQVLVTGGMDGLALRLHPPG